MKEHTQETLDILQRLDDERGKAVLAFAQTQMEKQERLAKFSHIPKWADRTTGREVTPVDFIKQHYGKINEDGSWDRDGLIMADIGNHDIELYNVYIPRILRKPHEDLGIPKENRVFEQDPIIALERKKVQARNGKRRQRSNAALGITDSCR